MDNRNEAEARRVVANVGEQYPIRPVGRELPDGRRDAGVRGTGEECLAHIDAVWTDMRPLSLRRLMAAGATGDGPA
ncbi:MbtH family NRPS accessory protein [Micromonospora sp. ATCC 39149]|uniref:MbtH family NRPS accessory protein n=1 Tax=Micromonospora carbonacea TaxID=47853 RepID=A0A7D6CGG6_9ACTN|nr:MbtH family NRPS accessory protein [Micromonospora sp. ATCC 39149]QLK00960.1 MbtH family NRPS accessory protein [Micromonospora carbonacea]